MACRAKRLMQARSQSFLVGNDARSHRFCSAGFPGLSGKDGHEFNANAHIIVRQWGFEIQCHIWIEQELFKKVVEIMKILQVKTYYSSTAQALWRKVGPNSFLSCMNPNSFHRAPRFSAVLLVARIPGTRKMEGGHVCAQQSR